MDYILQYYNEETHKLILPNTFNQRVKNLPNSITHLSLGYYFNQVINKYPDSLIELSYYSSSIINNLPYIKSLFIHFLDDDKYNNEIKNIPITVKKIKIIMSNKIYLLKNIPFECKIMNYYNKILN